MTLLDKTNTMVIVPAYNEQDSIVSVIEEIKATGFPFVIIDDGSTDETRNRAIAAGARTISLPFNAGVGGSLKCGFQHAVKHGYKAVIQCDADGQHPTKFFCYLVDSANLKSSHLVIGSRFTSDKETMRVGKTRKIAMQMLSSVAKRANQVEVTDTTSGFRLISQPLLGQFAQRFPAYYLGDTFEALNVAASNNYSVSQISVPFSNRTQGKSSASNTYAISNVVKILCVQLMGLKFRIEKYQ
jgi:cellulose synthase/poly-beta-1,6-N-acetylglucosamine synthase-like glycosyltransferase